MTGWRGIGRAPGRGGGGGGGAPRGAAAGRGGGGGEGVSPTKLAPPCRTPRCPAVAGPRGLCAGCARAYERQRGTSTQRGYGWSGQGPPRRTLSRGPSGRG